MDYGKIKKCPDEIRCLDWITLIDRYWLVINDWLADIDWPDHLTCSSYSVRRETPWEDLVNKDSKCMHSTTSAALYRRQWVKIHHIFDEQIMIILVTCYAPGCLLALCECEWILEISAFSNNHLILCCFKLSNFLFDGCSPICKTKSPSNITPPFPGSYTTLATYFSRYYRLLFLKGTAATFN